MNAIDELSLFEVCSEESNNRADQWPAITDPDSPGGIRAKDLFADNVPPLPPNLVKQIQEKAQILLDEEAPMCITVYDLIEKFTEIDCDLYKTVGNFYEVVGGFYRVSAQIDTYSAEEVMIREIIRILMETRE